MIADANSGTGTLGALNLGELEDLAVGVLDEAAFHYFAGGAADEITISENAAAYRRLRLVPRVLCAGPNPGTETQILGTAVSSPVGVAPFAYQRVAHPEGELATARACAEAGVLMCLSSLSTQPLEQVVEASGPERRIWFQLYPYKDKAMTADVVARATAAGCRALVVTCDVAVHGRREREFRHDFALPEDCDLPCVPVPEDFAGPVSPTDVTSFMQEGLSWDDIGDFMEMTDLPVVLKGILSPEDAKIATDLGAAGIIVSNHGGRQLDTAIATIEILPEIVDAAGDGVEVLVDGGITRGTDVVKALALGAKGAMLARPITWALAIAGKEGVAEALAMLTSETADALALCGCSTPAEATRELVRSEP
jgi:4-hydroxymandelate oxidase